MSLQTQDNSKPHRGGNIEREGMVVTMRPMSILFFDDYGQKEIFVPISQVKDWWFTTTGSKDGLGIEDLEPDDEVTLIIHRWLAVKERLV